MNKWSKIQGKVYKEKIEEVNGLFVEVCSNTSNARIPRCQWLIPLENWASKQIKESTSLKLSLQEFSHLKELIENLNNDLARNHGEESGILDEFHDTFINDYYIILESKANDLKLEITAELIEEKQFPLELFAVWYEEAHKLPPEQFNEELGNFWGDVWRNAAHGAGYGALAGGAAGGIPTGGTGTFAGAGLGGLAGGLLGGAYGGASHLLKRVWKYRQTQRNFEQTKQKAIESLKKLKELSKGFDIDPNFVQSLDSMIDQLGTTRAYRAAGTSPKPTPTDSEAEPGRAVNPMEVPDTDSSVTSPGIPTPTPVTPSPTSGSPTSSTIAPPVAPSPTTHMPPAAPSALPVSPLALPSAPSPAYTHSLAPSGLGSTATIPTATAPTPKPPRRPRAPIPTPAAPTPTPAAPTPTITPEPEVPPAAPEIPVPLAKEPEAELEINLKDEKHVLDYYEKIKDDPIKMARMGLALTNAGKFEVKKDKGGGNRRVVLKDTHPLDTTKFSDHIKELQAGAHDHYIEDPQDRKDAEDLAKAYIENLKERLKEKAEDEALTKTGTPKETPPTPGTIPVPTMNKEEILADLENKKEKYQQMSVPEFKNFLQKHNLYDLIPVDDRGNRPVGGHNSTSRGAAIIALKDKLGGTPPEPSPEEPKIEPTTGQPVEDKKFSEKELKGMDLKKLKNIAKSTGISHMFDDQSNKVDYVAELSNFYEFPEKYASDIAKGKVAKQESVIHRYKRMVQENKLASLPMSEKIGYLKSLLRA